MATDPPTVSGRVPPVSGRVPPGHVLKDAENAPTVEDSRQQEAASATAQSDSDEQPSASLKPAAVVLESDPKQMTAQPSDTSTGKTTEAAACEAPASGSKDQFPFDRSLLQLSERELQRALGLKGSFRRLRDLDNLSDFMYAHLAIAAKDDLEWAIDRAYKMQRVRSEYSILGTYEDGVQAIRAFMDFAPKTLMSFTFNPHTGKSVLVIDGVVPLQELWREPKNVNITIRGCFYLCYATFPTLQCVRVGNTHVFELEGHSWGKGVMQAKNFVKLTNHTHGAFPSVIKETRFYNTPSVANMFFTMVNKFIPQEVSDRHKVGCKFSGGRLSNFYMVPTPEEASQRTFLNICSGLKIRMESEKAFSLDDFKPPAKEGSETLRNPEPLLCWYSVESKERVENEKRTKTTN